MTPLNKTLRRVTNARRHEKSKHRHLILSLEPPAKVGVRLEATRRTYRLDAEAVYEIAVQAHERKIERRAKQIAKEERLHMRSAKAKARKQLLEELR